MKYNDLHIASTVVEELEKSNSVFAFGLKLKSPFSTDASTIQGLRAFLFAGLCSSVRALSGSQPNLLDSSSKGVRSLSQGHKLKGYSFKRSFLCRLRVDKRIETIQRFKVGFLKGELGDSARYPISGISERKGDDLTGSIPDHAVVAHSKNNKQYRINDFFSIGLNSYCFTGLVIGHITLNPLKE